MNKKHHMAFKQRTIAKTISLKGFGLHSGKKVELSFKPAPENHGIKFQRSDLEGKPIIEALVTNVIDTSRSTVLGKNGARIGTVEHVLSAISGLEIDNILIDITGEETPILDGSSKIFVNALLDAGIVEQEADKTFFEINENIRYSDEKNGIELIAIPDDSFSLNVMIDYNSSVLGSQYAYFNGKTDYKKDIAACKTFVFFRELEYLLENNLIKGGSLDNALIILEREVSQEELDRIADLFNKPRIKVKSQGILNNTELVFKNEPARHKLLDLMGDLMLVGKSIKGRIIATKPGHYSNVEFAKKIFSVINQEKKTGQIPQYDPNIDPVFEVNRIKEILPHRPPFLLVDKITEMSDSHIVGIKNVTLNEPFFAGHFPDEPIMPGVLIVEAMAQCGGILVLSPIPDPENYSTYFLKIDKVKFKRKVVPGDTLVFCLKYSSPIKRGIASMEGKAYVGNNLVMEGEMMAQIVKNK